MDNNRTDSNMKYSYTIVLSIVSIIIGILATRVIEFAGNFYYPNSLNYYNEYLFIATIGIILSIIDLYVIKQTYICFVNKY
jgi:hypothetical protein